MHKRPPPVRLSRRCFVRYSSKEPFTEVAAARGAAALSGGTHLSTSFAGNSYYSALLNPAAATSADAARPLQWNPGDVVIEYRSTPFVPSSLQQRRVVDVSGISTSFYDASERSPSAKASLSELYQTMHWHDGSVVPELCRGSLPVGHLTIRGVYHHNVGSGGRRALKTFPIENAAALFLSSSSLTFESHDSGKIATQLLVGKLIAAPPYLMIPVTARGEKRNALTIKALRLELPSSL